MKIKLEDIGSSVEVLKCPVSDTNHMHLSRITIYNREKEDSDKVGVYKYEKDGSFQFTNKLNPTENPSDRRDGLSIYFHPEDETKASEIALDIGEHKGEIHINWRKII